MQVVELRDLSVAKLGETRLLTATTENIVRSLDAFGVAELHNVYDPELVNGLVENCVAYGESLKASVNKTTPLQFPAFYRFNSRSLASDVVALDPATASENDRDFKHTTLHAAVFTDLVIDVLTRKMGVQIGWAVARARVVLPDECQRNGRLSLHMEKTSHPFPGVHVIWAPLLPPGVITNGNAPGLRLFLGNQDFFTQSPDIDVAPVVNALEAGKMSGQVADDGFFYMPQVTTGDIVIFSGSVPHGTSVPAGATLNRTGFDVRVFPWTETNHLPARAVANGQQHARLL